MKTQLKIYHEFDGKYRFSLGFFNTSNETISLPLERFRLSASRVGLFIRDGDEVLNPLEFNVVSSRDNLQETILSAGGFIEIVISCEIKRSGKTSFILEFDNATYKITPEKIYDISFKMNGFESNVVQQSFVI
jgi:hypothetical protein